MNKKFIDDPTYVGVYNLPYSGSIDNGECVRLIKDGKTVTGEVDGVLYFKGMEVNENAQYEFSYNDTNYLNDNGNYLVMVMSYQYNGSVVKVFF